MHFAVPRALDIVPANDMRGNPAKWPHPDSNISSSIWASDGTTSHGASCVPARFNLLNLLVTEKSTLDGSTPLILSASHRPGVTSDSSALSVAAWVVRRGRITPTPLPQGGLLLAWVPCGLRLHVRADYAYTISSPSHTAWA